MINAANLANSSMKYDRNKTDFYATPEPVTQALLDYLGLSKTRNIIWEPACGEGHMSKVLESNGYETWSTNLHNQGYGEAGVDFLETNNNNFDWVITNPPFKLAEDFIRHCNELDLEGFALLLKSQYWHASSRTKLFKQIPPKYILALNWRPDFMFGERGGSPTMECIWCVWEATGPHRPIYDVLEKPGSEGER